MAVGKTVIPIPEVRCIFYSEFDNVKGPLIICQTPKSFFSPEECKEMRTYVLTESETRETVIVFTMETGAKLMGFPVYIESRKYERSKFLFNICFAFDATSTSRIKMFKPIVRKVGLYAKMLETRLRFLSKTEGKKERVQGHIDDIMAKINEKHVYFGNFTGSGALATRSKVLSSRKHMLFLDKYLAQYQQRGTRKLAGHHVPVFTDNGHALLKKKLHQNNTMMATILHLIDGNRFAREIAIYATVSLSLVLQALRQLLRVGCILVVDMFQETNIYKLNCGIQKLYSNARLQALCLRQLGGKRRNVNAGTLMEIFSRFQGGAMVSDVSYQMPTLGPDVLRRAVRFGVRHRLLRRVHRFPVLRHAQDQTPAPEGKAEIHRRLRALLSPPSHAALVATSERITSVHLQQQTDWRSRAISDDELCCELLLPLSTLMTFLETECDIVLK